MNLRALEERDAHRMLAWMHDNFVVEKLQSNFASKTIEDCLAFIANSQDEENVHLAITDDEDLYMGTVSLKHMNGTAAEFAITVGREAMGKGYGIWAMKEIINRGFEEYKLESIYWCVAPDNQRAVKFYDKNGFERVNAGDIDICGGYTKEQIDSYIWYQVLNSKI